ncbi:MAG: type III secretion system effector protein [Cellvibrionaceae bacterium]|nr:type III secretion system effector protein [Cellvibrionaceae bacterium]
MPTAAELVAGRAALRRADFGVVHSNATTIRARRAPGQTAADYYDHMLDTRRSMNTLTSQPVGRHLVQQLNNRGTFLDPGAPHNEHHNPYTFVDIFANNANTARPRLDPMNPIGSAQQAYRYNGVAGVGQGSRVGYNANQASANRFIGLGHELVHAYRNAHGIGVSPPDVSPRRNDAVLATPIGGGHTVNTVVGQHARLKEEFETVGIQATPGHPGIPTENGLRAEHGRPARLNYSGAVPGGPTDAALANVDAGTDNRNIFQRMVGTPSPVQQVVNHLET